MVKDVRNGECFRLDHLIKNHLEKLVGDKKMDKATKEEYNDIIVQLDGMTGRNWRGLVVTILTNQSLDMIYFYNIDQL